jgi:hypothetical protein
LNKEEIWTLVHYVNKFRFDGYGEEPVMEVEALDSTAMTETIVE